jgi:hypothetical protein
MALLLPWMDVLGYCETRGKDVLESQQLAVRLSSGIEEGYPLPGYGVLDHIACFGYGLLLSSAVYAALISSASFIGSGFPLPDHKA